MSEEHSGSCNCGAVRFTARGRLRDIIFCHCGQCRRQGGHFYAATNVADRDLEVTGEDNLTWYQSSDVAQRGFCRHCGSALFWKEDDADDISVLAGAFDQPSSLMMGCHIFCDDKADFYDLPDDGRPRYPGSRGD